MCVQDLCKALLVMLQSQRSRFVCSPDLLIVRQHIEEDDEQEQEEEADSTG